MDYIISSAIELGLIYALVPLALFLSFRVLGIADLTTDGSYILGMAVSVSLTLAGHPILGIFLGMLASALAGLVTALLQTVFGVPSILAGIVTNTGLYSINLLAMGFKSNLSILKEETVFTLFESLGIGGKYNSTILILLIIVVASILLVLFLNTRLGLSIRATGDNINMVQSSSINPTLTITIGLCVSNALTGLCGALVGQMQSFSDINAGTGIVTIGLACLIIGETIIGRKNINRNVIAAIIGSIVYRLIYAIVVKTKIVPIEMMKLLTALIVAIAIAFPMIKTKLKLSKSRREHRGNKYVEN